MIWMFVVFGISLFILRKAVFPLIGEALDRRAKTIDRRRSTPLRRSARRPTQVLDEYRERLQEAREQAEEIVTRARKAGDVHQQRRSRPRGPSASGCSSRPAATSRPRPAARSTRSAARSPT